MKEINQRETVPSQPDKQLTSMGEILREWENDIEARNATQWQRDLGNIGDMLHDTILIAPCSYLC